jgi:SAM-dependent methyltransferase
VGEKPMAGVYDTRIMRGVLGFLYRHDGVGEVKNILVYIQSQKRLVTKFYAAIQMLYVVLLSPFIIRGRAVLDVGCGSGILGATFPNVTSVDKEDGRLFPIPMTIVDAVALSYSDNMYDTIFLLGVWEHIGDLSDVLRCLAHGGYLVVTIPRGFLWRFIKSDKEGVIDHKRFALNPPPMPLPVRFAVPVIPGLFWFYILRKA